MRIFDHPVVVIHGRFQIFHRDHLRYVSAALERGAHVVIGLTGIPYLAGDADASTPAHRLRSGDNPLTYHERVEMIDRALRREGVDATRFSFVPFPIEQPERLPYFVGEKAVMVTTIREPWNEAKVERLRRLGYEVEVAYTDLNKEISGGEIRDLIRRGDRQWEELVPPGAVEYLKEIDIQARLATLGKAGER